MNRSNPYFEQVQLLVRILPVIATEECFALKGGTAINLFYRDMPRLSVDIDLVYTPIKAREDSLREITDGMSRMGRLISERIPRAKVHYIRLGRTDAVVKLVVRLDRSVVKIELSPVLRGTVYPSSLRRICPSAEAAFGFAEVPVVSFEDLFAGKIVAALDRQHPRDLFDVKLLLENEGITARLKEAFLVYLISHDRRFLEVLNPTLIDIRETFVVDFERMTVDPVDVADLERTRLTLIDSIATMLTPQDKAFVVAFKEGDPDWNHFGPEHIRDLPAIKWKRYNLGLMDTPKRNAMIQSLKHFFAIRLTGGPEDKATGTR
ncbi:MAG: nucleotidyl transferase AbiEii/AbiGii toxin family protein [Spirochaetaceae bacterium]|nr:MAG: nucleotidyl transferase AbiEii/AbiGii toxin family protein [Spirochaetaceae bacterium]